MPQPRSRSVVVEAGRELGWTADRELLNRMADAGWDPVDFRLTRNGLEIEFELSNPSGPSTWVYDCNQEGGTIETLLMVLGHFSSDLYWTPEDNPHNLEAVFFYRVESGSSGAREDGFYVRFFGRRPRDHSATWPGGWEYLAVENTGKAPVSRGGKWTYLASMRNHPDQPAEMAVYRRPIDA